MFKFCFCSLFNCFIARYKSYTHLTVLLVCSIYSCLQHWNKTLASACRNQKFIHTKKKEFHFFPQMTEKKWTPVPSRLCLFLSCGWSQLSLSLSLSPSLALSLCPRALTWSATVNFHGNATGYLLLPSQSAV